MSTIKERPILFSARMVRAIKAGTQTQTRRVAKPNASGRLQLACPYGNLSDRLWVRETWMPGPVNDDWTENANGSGKPLYKADWGNVPEGSHWRPSIHMPRWASRITLEITGVRVERLQAISAADAMAEGVVECNEILRNLGPCMEWRYAYEDLWRSINGPGSWDANPWVWVIKFKRVTP